MVNKIYKYVTDKYNSNEPLKIEWLFVGVILLSLLALFLHGDTKNLITWSINMLDVTFDGNPFDYYKYSIQNPNLAPSPYVSGTLYSLMIWAIWNLPIWIMKQIFGVGILESPLVWIWGKLFLVFCLGVTMKYVYDITKIMTNDKNRAKWAMFLLASSVFVIIGVGYGGQNDIVICMFATAAVKYLIEGKYKLFYFLAGMAISVKYFFLIPYIAIVLLYEKKIFKIIVKILTGCVPTLIFWGITRFCPMVDVAANQGSPISVLLKEMLGGSFEVVYGNYISLFLAMLLIVYVMAYLTIPKDSREQNLFLIYYIVASTISMFLFSTFQYYRVVMLCPFMAIIMVLNKNKMRINVIIDTIISGCLYIILAVQGCLYVFTSNYIVKRLFSGLEIKLNMSLGNWVWQSFSPELVTTGLQICATVVVVLSILLLVINHPRIKNTIFDMPKIKTERWIYWVRSLIVIPSVIYLFYSAFI